MTELTVEVVLALPETVLRKSLQFMPGATVAEAVEASGLMQHPNAPAELEGNVGVWNQPCDPGQELQAGDRVELYRPLTVDPMVARRRRAAHRQRGR